MCACNFFPLTLARGLLHRCVVTAAVSLLGSRRTTRSPRVRNSLSFAHTLNKTFSLSMSAHAHAADIGFQADNVWVRIPFAWCWLVFTQTCYFDVFFFHFLNFFNYNITYIDDSERV